MTRWAWLVLTVQLLGGASTAQGLHQLPATGLAWRMKPNGDDIARVYPSKAQREGKAGWAVIECLTVETGDLKDCKVLGETPSTYGFGAAALSLAPKFKLDPKKMDPSTLANGVIAIPIILLTPVGAIVPLRDYLAGDPSGLVTVAKDGGRGVPCPSAEKPTQKCLTHSFIWARRPTIAETAVLVRSVTAAPPVTGLNCSIREDMQLTNCITLGAADTTQAAAMDGLIALFTVPAEADDKTPMRRGQVLVQFNWPALRHAVETSVLTNPRP